IIPMAKCILFFLVFQVLLYNTYSQVSGKFILEGKIIGRSNGKLYLLYSAKNKPVIDSAEVRNGSFVFQGPIDEPTTAELTDNLKMKNSGYGNYISNIYLEQGKIKLSVVDG